MESSGDYTILADIKYADGSKSLSVDGMCNTKEGARKMCEQKQIEYDELRKLNSKLPKITWSYRKIKR